MEKIASQFTGVWVHMQDDLLPTFFEAVGASDGEKQYMLTSTPKLSFSVTGDLIKTTNMPHPIGHPEDVAEYDFRLNEAFNFQPKGLLLKIIAEWKDGKMIQNVTPVNSSILPHSIEHHVNDKGQLIEIFKLTDSAGKEVKGTRTFKKEDQQT